jgi:transposase
MSLEIYPNYNQTFLFPPRLEEFVPMDHPARFIREFVESLDLDALGFSRRIAEEGRPNYSAELMLKIWLYGYFMKIRSSRTLEKACMEHMGLVWLTGMIYPDHNSIWRFFKANRASIRRVFKRSVQLAASMNLVGMVLHAVDGTKIQADAGRKTSLHRDDLTKRLEQLDRSLDTLMSQIEMNETLEHGKDYKLPEEFARKLADRQAVKETIIRQLKQLDAEGLDHYNEADPDARMMKQGKGIEFGYNAQVAVDDQSGILVGLEVVTDASDSHNLGRMLDTVTETVGETAQQTVADGGYFSGETLSEAEEKGREVLIPIRDEAQSHVIECSSEFHILQFVYDASSDTYRCPKGGTLTFQRIKTHCRKNYAVRVYHCKDYRTCPFRDQCSKDKRGRKIEISPYAEVIDCQRKKQEGAENQERLLKRKEMVELVFGVMKHNWGFRRWTVRGLDNVKTQWSLLCTTYNLKKIYRIWKDGKENGLSLSHPMHFFIIRSYLTPPIDRSISHSYEWAGCNV